MSLSPAMDVIEAYCVAHQRVLKLTANMTNEHLVWRPTPIAHPIAFHLWHIARWADHLQAAVPGMTRELGQRLVVGVQIWEAEAIAGAWGFTTEALGYAGTGMYMPDEIALVLPFPEKAILMEYVHQALAAAEHAARAIDDAQFVAIEASQPLTEGIWTEGNSVGGAILSHMVHINRHLGAIEALYGCQVGSGTASV